MTKPDTAAPLLIRPQPSRRLAALLGLLGVASIVVCLALPLVWPARIGLILVVVLWLSYETSLHLLRRLPWAVREVLWGADGTWLVTDASGAQITAQLAPTTFVGVGLIVLNLRCGRLRRCHLPLFSDSLDPSQHRRLRARLRRQSLTSDGSTYQSSRK